MDAYRSSIRPDGLNESEVKMNTFTIYLFLLVVAALYWLRTKLPWLANLPGDLIIPVGKVHVVIPLATCFIASVIVTIILLLVGRKP